MTTLNWHHIKIIEEVAELMRGISKNAFTRYILLRPKNLRLAAGADLPDWLRKQLEPEEYKDEYLCWDSLEPESLESRATWPAFWELLGMTEASSSDIHSFTAQWGMLSSTWEGSERGDSFDLDGHDAIAVEGWRDFVDSARQLLSLIVLTAKDELITPDLVEVVQDWDELPDWPPLPENVGELPPEELTKLVNKMREAPSVRAQMRREALIAERAQGKGLEQQRRLSVHRLTSQLGMQYAHFEWDERGRRMEHEAFGLNDVVFSHIATIFSSPELDVLVCSMCGKPYPFDEESSGRRPRFGVRRFCSDACRQTGKRESNRSSWRRNSTRWRRRTTSKRKNEEMPADG